jgi:hypothetical protein
MSSELIWASSAMGGPKSGEAPENALATALPIWVAMIAQTRNKMLKDAKKEP